MTGDAGERRTLPVVAIALVLLLAMAGLVGATTGTDLLVESAPGAKRPSVPRPSTPPTPAPSSRPAEATPPPEPTDRIFADDRVLVAFYGTGGTGSLGVLGETSPDEMERRLAAAARPFRLTGRPVRKVYELIVTVADPAPGPDGDYHHDIARATVERYIAAARRHDALLLLDLQPGRADFLQVARRWAWALRDPRVGLALDPEWRMGPREVPGQVIGSVRAAEIDRVSAWLAELQRRAGLPEKLFVIHQFRRDMVPDLAMVQPRPGLAMVQHVDGFGTRAQKLATYREVAEPDRFALGFKLFYDEDVGLMPPRAVLAIRPKVRFVSYQ